jgi:hypothetical protein
VQDHADDVPDAHLVPERVRDQVVEGLVDGRYVRKDPDDQRLHPEEARDPEASTGPRRT